MRLNLGAVADTVRYELDGHVATITYHRPDKLNVIDQQMRTELNAAFAAFRDDEDAWVGIVTGSGRAFCAGADIRSPGNPAGEFPGTFWEKPTVNSFESGWEIYKPMIAAVNGYCLGYGLTLVTWCDFVIASEQAIFGYPEVRIGTPTIVGAIRLPQRIGWQYAMELLLTGEQITAARAKEIGLAGWVVPHSSLLSAARERAWGLLHRQRLRGTRLHRQRLRGTRLHRRGLRRSRLLHGRGRRRDRRIAPRAQRRIGPEQT